MFLCNFFGYFINIKNFYHKFIVSSLRIENEQVSETPIISGKNNIIVGVKVDVIVPINARVFRIESMLDPKK